MDAASRTGVDDIRELTEGVRYRPVAARYKIYIIDEVHMLSKQAFNALLKTLEEPPPDVIFIFATTEIHKVPVTVLSRCQRFSLRRVPIELLIEHYTKIAAAEAVAAEPAAIALIARAADGSVRDGLSLLDQAIALGGGTIGEALGARDARHRRPRPGLRPPRGLLQGRCGGRAAAHGGALRRRRRSRHGAPGSSGARAFPDPAQAGAGGGRGRSGARRRARARPRAR